MHSLSPAISLVAFLLPFGAQSSPPIATWDSVLLAPAPENSGKDRVPTLDSIAGGRGIRANNAQTPHLYLRPGKEGTTGDDESVSGRVTFPDDNDDWGLVLCARLRADQTLSHCYLLLWTNRETPEATDDGLMLVRMVVAQDARSADVGSAIMALCGRGTGVSKELVTTRLLWSITGRQYQYAHGKPYDLSFALTRHRDALANPSDYAEITLRVQCEESHFDTGLVCFTDDEPLTPGRQGIYMFSQRYEFVPTSEPMTRPATRAADKPGHSHPATTPAEFK